MQYFSHFIVKCLFNKTQKRFNRFTSIDQQARQTLRNQHGVRKNLLWLQACARKVHRHQRANDNKGGKRISKTNKQRGHRINCGRVSTHFSTYFFMLTFLITSFSRAASPCSDRQRLQPPSPPTHPRLGAGEWFCQCPPNQHPSQWPRPLR